MLPEKNQKIIMGMLMAFIVGGSIDLSIENKSYKEHYPLSNLKNNHNTCSQEEKEPKDAFSPVNQVIIDSVAISPKDPIIFSGGDGKITHLNVDTGEKVEWPNLRQEQGSYESLAISLDGQIIASGGHGSNHIYIRKLSDQKYINRLQQSGVTSLIFSPDGNILVSGSENGEIKIWNLNTSTAKSDKSLNHATGVTSLAISSDGKILVSGSKNGEIKIWNLETSAAQFDKSLNHATGVTSLAISPDGNILASGSENGEIKIWDLKTGTGQYDFKHAGMVTSLAINSDSNILVSGSMDGTIKIWSIGKGLFISIGEVINTYNLREYLEDTKITLSIRQDGILVSSQELSNIKIWWLP